MISLINRILSPQKAPSLLQKAAKPTTKASMMATPITETETEEVVSSETNLRKAKLIMVTVNNNNKFYDMCENADDTFTATYGRVGSHGTSRTYNMDQWEAKKKEKVRKGYTDTTHLFSNAKALTDFLAIENQKVAALMEDLNSFAKQSVYKNYNVSSEAVTMEQLKEAQAILDKLSKKVKRRLDAEAFNEKLMNLYTIIPRRMTHVKEHLVHPPRSNKELQEIRTKLSEEQATLDVMRGQVELHNQQAEQQEKRKTLLKAFGLQIEALEDKKLIKEIKKRMGDRSDNFVRAYKVINLKTQKAFDKHLEKCSDKTTQLFWHGSRNENWLSILKTGLVLRPANAVINGKMFGYGLYFADQFSKSLNYSSLVGSYWSGGTQSKGFLALYDTHVGKQLKIKRHNSWCSDLNHKNLKKKGSKYDSVFAKGGADLINNEYIVYKQEQCTIRYIVEVG